MKPSDLIFYPTSQRFSFTHWICLFRTVFIQIRYNERSIRQRYLYRLVSVGAIRTIRFISCQVFVFTSRSPPFNLGCGMRSCSVSTHSGRALRVLQIEAVLPLRTCARSKRAAGIYESYVHTYSCPGCGALGNPIGQICPVYIDIRYLCPVSPTPSRGSQIHGYVQYQW